MNVSRTLLVAAVATLAPAFGAEARAQGGGVIDVGRPGGRVLIDPGRPGGRLVPGYDPGAPGGRVIPAPPGTYPVRNRGGWGRGRGWGGYGPGRYGAPAVRRYQIPGGYYGTPAGRIINYGGANYITHADGTMSPY